MDDDDEQPPGPGTWVRGYTVHQARDYLTRRTGSPPAVSFSMKFPGDHWVPVRYISELYCLVAELGNGVSEQAKQELITCGRDTAKTATGTFLRRLMRFLPPHLFAKQLPNLWRRDTNGGEFHVDVSDTCIQCLLTDMQEYAHIGPISFGYVAFALECMGKQILASSLQGWSLHEPYREQYLFELRW